ncbi:chitinase [Synchytrium microbalum]|uniref:chitinase n=1 Tax=Synchytrium microbalum TaxID=1806994 RepID=A0A507CAW8_9FUNG|nr:chitinase [Synchytrium microbalum]TPX34673.1 chitinase [Synchytrium microbalum]
MSSHKGIKFLFAILACYSGSVIAETCFQSPQSAQYCRDGLCGPLSCASIEETCESYCNSMDKKATVHCSRKLIYPNNHWKVDCSCHKSDFGELDALKYSLNVLGEPLPLHQVECATSTLSSAPLLIDEAPELKLVRRLNLQQTAAPSSSPLPSATTTSAAASPSPTCPPIRYFDVIYYPGQMNQLGWVWSCNGWSCPMPHCFVNEGPYSGWCAQNGNDLAVAGKVCANGTFVDAETCLYPSTKYFGRCYPLGSMNALGWTWTTRGWECDLPSCFVTQGPYSGWCTVNGDGNKIPGSICSNGNFVSVETCPYPAVKYFGECFVIGNVNRLGWTWTLDGWQCPAPSCPVPSGQYAGWCAMDRDGSKLGLLTCMNGNFVDLGCLSPSIRYFGQCYNIGDKNTLGWMWSQAGWVCPAPACAVPSGPWPWDRRQMRLGWLIRSLKLILSPLMSTETFKHPNSRNNVPLSSVVITALAIIAAAVWALVYTATVSTMGLQSESCKPRQFAPLNTVSSADAAVDTAFEEYRVRHERALRNVTAHPWIISKAIYGGLGNRLPQLVNGIVLALLTNRTVLLEYPDHVRNIWNFNLDLDRWNRDLGEEEDQVMIVGEAVLLKERARKLFTDCITEDLSAYYDDPEHGGVRTWVILGVDYFVPFWQANPHYRKKFETIFPDGRVAYHVLRKTLGLRSALDKALSEYKAAHFRPYMVGIHVRAHKLKNIGYMRSYATIAKQLAMVSGRPMDEVGFHLATDNVQSRDELISWLGVDYVSYLPVNFTANNGEGNPGGSDEFAAIDYVALGSCDAVVATYGSSFGQWAGSWSGRPYVTMNQRLDTYNTTREVSFWNSLISEPCSFSVKQFAETPGAGSHNLTELEEQYARDVMYGNWASIEKNRETRAVSFLMALPQYLHHTQYAEVKWALAVQALSAAVAMGNNCDSSYLSWWPTAPISRVVACASPSILYFGVCYSVGSQNALGWTWTGNSSTWQCVLPSCPVSTGPYAGWCTSSGNTAAIPGSICSNGNFTTACTGCCAPSISYFGVCYSVNQTNSLGWRWDGSNWQCSAPSCIVSSGQFNGWCTTDGDTNKLPGYKCSNGNFVSTSTCISPSISYFGTCYSVGQANSLGWIWSVGGWQCPSPSCIVSTGPYAGWCSSNGDTSKVAGSKCTNGEFVSTAVCTCCAPSISYFGVCYSVNQTNSLGWRWDGNNWQCSAPSCIVSSGQFNGWCTTDGDTNKLPGYKCSNGNFVSTSTCISPSISYFGVCYAVGQANSLGWIWSVSGWQCPSPSCIVSTGPYTGWCSANGDTSKVAGSKCANGQFVSTAACTCCAPSTLYGGTCYALNQVNSLGWTWTNSGWQCSSPSCSVPSGPYAGWCTTSDVAYTGFTCASGTWVAQSTCSTQTVWNSNAVAIPSSSTGYDGTSTLTNLNGATQFNPQAGAWWFASTGSTCYDVSRFSYLTIYVRIIAGPSAPLSIGFDIYDPTCTTKANTLFYAVSAVTVSTTSWQMISVNLASVITDSTSRQRVKAIVLTGFSVGSVYQWSSITFQSCLPTPSPVASIAPSPVPSPIPLRTDLPILVSGQCGPTAGGICNVQSTDSCCSAYGYCGSGTTWCGAGCQPAYGNCDGNPRPSPSPTASPLICSPGPSATPTMPASFNSRLAAGTLIGGYWGQNSYGGVNPSQPTKWQKNLDYYCDVTQGSKSTVFDYLVISFLDIFPFTSVTVNGSTYYLPQVETSAGCSGSGINGLNNCSSITSAIEKCQSLGRKVFLSIGGATGNFNFAVPSVPSAGPSPVASATTKNTASATSVPSTTVFSATTTTVVPAVSATPAPTDMTVQLAYAVWNMFLGGTSAPWNQYRPFGSVVLDGIDLDIESGNPSGWPSFVAQLRTLMTTDSTRQYYISAAPQCPYPDLSDGPGMGTVLGAITASTYIDLVQVQFYNNPSCALNAFQIGSSTQLSYNYATWANWAKTVNTTIVILVPASIDAAGSGYIAPDVLSSVVTYSKAQGAFAGLSMWDVSQDQNNLINYGPGCINQQPYSRAMRSMLSG